MEKSELQRLIATYDNLIFFNLSEDEWHALTDNFKVEMIEEILLRVSECCSGQTDSEVIATQLEMLRDISNAQCRLLDSNEWCPDAIAKYDFSAALSLKIKGGLFLRREQIIDIPTKEDNTPDWEALQQLLSYYSSTYHMMDRLVSKLHAKADEDSQLLSVVKRHEKEIEYYKRLENELQTLKDENRRLKMEKKELSMMSQKLAEKAGHDDLMKVLQTYMNKSKRKDAKKREHIKMLITEMAQSARLTLPEEMLQVLDNFDDDNSSDRPMIGEYVSAKYVENEIQVEAGGNGVVKNINTGNDGF